eukprot:TRINITY_DN2181_c0_g1::TRINITY_DN2181_c0_g1_i3::g.12785::m.12785 TRINITY_DN2181_c0_g1::TRINITY_DN2181_c0_g1_i3::g.12785  ORF type:complete len:271 (+),score=0.32,sp/Q5SX19/PIGL_MOUSE/37.12/2e-37,PIG-L/PF02585.12/6.4e-25,DUF965/PF06135.7/0.085 TRINITY_DN2181_c0_g1_i3:103-915(+)
MKIVFFLSILLPWLAWTLQRYSTVASDIGSKQNILLVIAHPDDEAMFFVPTITTLLSMNFSLSLLCFSNGNADQLGRIRQQELASSAKFLGISQVEVLDSNLFQDGFDKSWNIVDIHHALEQYTLNQTFTSIITFDSYGVSGHPNHIDLHNGVRSFLRKTQRVDMVLYLDSVPLWRKYLGLFDFFISYFESAAVVRPDMDLFRSRGLCSEQILFVHNILPYHAHVAMSRHTSQYVWFRKLFVLFSRYTYLNVGYLDCDLRQNSPLGRSHD